MPSPLKQSIDAVSSVRAVQAALATLPESRSINDLSRHFFGALEAHGFAVVRIDQGTEWRRECLRLALKHYAFTTPDDAVRNAAIFAEYLHNGIAPGEYEGDAS